MRKQLLKNQALTILAVLLSLSLILWSCSSAPTEVTPNQTHYSVQKITANQAETDTCINGRMDTGAYFRICMPDEWNGDLVLYAHGYVSPLEEVAIPESQLKLPDGTYIPAMLNDLGYAFATTSYRENGFVAAEAIEDLKDLVDLFKELYPTVNHILLVGASEGGLITTKSIEMEDDYAGGLAVCGPIGDFIKQINYVGDFRVLFDFYFPGILPGSPVQIPQEVMEHWDDIYLPAVIQAISADPDRTVELLRVAGAAFDPSDPETVGQTVAGVLWYNVFATNDLVARVGGNPYDNSTRFYHGSANDLFLNQHVRRFTADAVAITAVNHMFQTEGILDRPLVTMHTAGDPIVPFWHEQLYRQKIVSSGSAIFFNHIPVVRYGHCNFSKDEVLKAFTLLIVKVKALEEVAAPQPVTVRVARKAIRTR